jgi:hypothetical protein
MGVSMCWARVLSAAAGRRGFKYTFAIEPRVLIEPIDLLRADELRDGAV